MAEHDQPGKPEEDGAAAHERTITVGIVADPGIAAKTAERVANFLPTALPTKVDDTVSWRVETECEELSLDEQGNIQITGLIHHKMADREWDYLIALTDLPRRVKGRPILSSFSIEHRTAVISLPAAGWFWPRRHVQQVSVHFLAEAHAAATSGCMEKPRGPAKLSPPLRVFPVTEEEMDPYDTYTALVGFWGRARLLFGMVRDNRPWRLVPSLSSALAAASATAAFGVFYGSIWAIADALSPLRLTLISTFAVVAMVVWLIIYNNLWEWPVGRSARQDAVLYNSVTIVTLLFGVACMYALLFTATLIGVNVVIETQLLQSELGHPVGFAEYVSIAWLASSMGTIAGALGSTFESEEAIHTAAYSKRELERRARFDDSRDAGS